MPDPQDFGKRVSQLRREKAAREERDIVQQEIADAIGVSNVTYSRYEAGRVPEDAILGRLAQYFGVSRSWLRYGEGERFIDAVMIDADGTRRVVQVKVPQGRVSGLTEALVYDQKTGEPIPLRIAEPEPPPPPASRGAKPAPIEAFTPMRSKELAAAKKKPKKKRA